MHELLVNRLFKPAQEKVWLGKAYKQLMSLLIDLGKSFTTVTVIRIFAIFL